SLVAAFPEDARTQRQFALILSGRAFDERRLVTFARDRASLRGGDLEQRRHVGRRLWVGKGEGAVAGFFLDAGTFALGGGGWTERLAEWSAAKAQVESNGGNVDPSLPRRPSAAANPELANLVSRITSGGDRPPALWAAAIVPAEIRNQLASD